jgi:hypothetical protein
VECHIEFYNNKYKTHEVSWQLCYICLHAVLTGLILSTLQASLQLQLLNGQKSSALNTSQAVRASMKLWRYMYSSLKYMSLESAED